MNDLPREPTMRRLGSSSSDVFRAAADQSVLPTSDSSSSTSSSSSMDLADQQMIQELFQHYDDAELARVQAIERDIMGTHGGNGNQDMDDTVTSDSDGDSSSHNEETLLKNALRGFHDALAQAEASKKAAYIKALELNPRVVHMETPVERYLQGCGYNFWLAVDRITNYWTKRHEIFQERYHLPLDLSGTGALSPFVIQSLEAGHAMALAPDQFHRTTLLFDVDRRPQVLCTSIQHRTQVYFYMVHVSVESKMACNRGVVMLVAMSAHNQNFFHVKGGAISSLTKHDIWPTKIRAVHFCFDNNMNMLQKTLAKGLFAVMKNMSAMKDRIRVHYFSPEDAQKEMGPFGITRNHIPDRLGGTVDDKVIAGWFQWRRKLESERYGHLKQESEKAGANKEKVFDLKPYSSKTTGIDRAEVLKRQMEEVHLHNKAAMKRRRVEKLRREQASLQKESTILDAHVKWSQGIAAQHSHQKSMIIEHLQGLLIEPLRITSLDGMPACLVNDEGCINFKIKPRILECFEYLGRHILTGHYMFQTTPTVDTLDPKNRLLMDFLLARIPLDLFNKSLTTQQVLASNDDPLVDVRQAPKESDRDFHSRLRQVVSKLESRKSQLEKENEFLQSSLVLAHSVRGAYEEYQTANVETVSRIVNEVMHTRTGIDLQALFETHHNMHPQTIARRLLAGGFMWMGQQRNQQFSIASVENMLRVGGYLSPVETGPLPEHPPCRATSCSSGVSISRPEAIQTTTTPSRIPTQCSLSADERRQRVKSRRKEHLRRL